MKTSKERADALSRQGLKVQFASGPRGDRYFVTGHDGTTRALNGDDLKLLDETGKLTWRGIAELGASNEE